MKFGFLGINYKNAGLDIRDKTAFTDHKKMEFLCKAEQAGIEQCMILSTCNRSEIYYFYTEDVQVLMIRKLYQEMFPEVSLKKYLIQWMGEDAISYLFRVTAGLESLILGEDQILGQVKDALDFSRTMGYAKKEMNKVVRDAITCAKKIKTELKISEIPLSVSYVGIKKLNELSGISGKTILVIGSGKTAVLALQYIYEYEDVRVLICNRTQSHVEEIKRQFSSVEVISYEERYQAMKFCDIVVSATAAPHLIIKREGLLTERPMFFLDLAAPRDIDTAIGNMRQMTLMNLDTLHQIVTENQKEREVLVDKGQAMVAVGAAETIEWLMSSRVDGTIQSLQQRCEDIVNDSYAYLNRKMDLDLREQKILKKVLHASLHRLLKEPIEELKHLDTREKQDAYQEVVRQLFQIEK